MENFYTDMDKLREDIYKRWNKTLSVTNIPYSYLSEWDKDLIFKRPKIKRVIFNSPATIILWDDGTKTVVKCQPGDTYDKEKGFMAAYLKKLLGNDNTFNKEINKWVWED